MKVVFPGVASDAGRLFYCTIPSVLRLYIISRDSTSHKELLNIEDIITVYGLGVATLETGLSYYTF